MSRAGKRARRQRLIAAGQWQPSSILAAAPGKAAEDRAAAIFAERDLWVSTGGTLAWEREQARRRGERNTRIRERRLAHYRPALREAS